MGTALSVPIQAFFKRVEADRSFFNYLQLTDEEAMAIAEQRAKTYLNEACSIISMELRPAVDFTDIDTTNECFNFDLMDKEVFLLSSLMYEMYLDRDIAKIKTLSVNYTSTDLRVFDPSNARKTFINMYDFVCRKNELLKNTYSETDRDSGAFLTIDFASYDNGG